MKPNKYPILYLEVQNDDGAGYDFIGRDLSNSLQVFVGQDKLTNLLDELYKLRKEKYNNNEGKTSKVS